MPGEILPVLVAWRRTEPGQEHASGWAVPSRADLTVFLGYVVCAALYIAVGIFETNLLLSVWVAILYLLLTAYAVPKAVRRLRR